MKLKLVLYKTHKYVQSAALNTNKHTASFAENFRDKLLITHLYKHIPHITRIDKN